MKTKANQHGLETLLRFYREMQRVRQFDQKAAELFTQGRMAGNIHTCVGQEATAVGACQALEPTDFITATHRGHGHCLAKGGRAAIMMAELFGKATGYCKGKGGSMHIADLGLGILGANGIVGAGIPIAAGSALASKIKGGREVTLAFFGDGASNEGAFHEALNMASAWRLPVIFLCENNKYGVSVAIDRVTSIADIADRAKAYDIPGIVVDGNDVVAVFEAVSAAAARARAGEGPSLIEAKTYRHRGHYEGDPQIYKPADEVAAWKKRDPLILLQDAILALDPAAADKLAAVEDEIRREIEDAVRFAEESPYPGPAEVVSDVYAADNERSVAR
ncbi:thiamine pyrophosphate-dependent dehydrogenase E1 component subunit alpha [Anaeroselena agilis]|uniref:Thiamine pyrophosphate-dependent dehydrogenase E1 component subunit alpha n=1 Tax=Anaeroselena agilis TaxID=3063788 RepID=A0ABU3NXX5_9FIRM|nr:thiamine pyrophosphate-dependent dehydrogenase E1 component subunit alpha [Selenomonadales bacterium 4137-cl]